MIGSVEFFADGPFAGWHEVQDHHLAYCVDQFAPGEAVHTPGVHPKAVKSWGVVVYTRYRWFGAGWLISIPIWMTASRFVPGTVIPGIVVGARLSQCPLEWRRRV